MKTIILFKIVDSLKRRTTKVFSKVLADGSNSAIVLSFSSSFGRPNTMRQ